jgi:hypothetical protein
MLCFVFPSLYNICCGDEGLLILWTRGCAKHELSRRSSLRIEATLLKTILICSRRNRSPELFNSHQSHSILLLAYTNVSGWVHFIGVPFVIFTSGKHLHWRSTGFHSDPPFLHDTGPSFILDDALVKLVTPIAVKRGRFPLVSILSWSTSELTILFASQTLPAMSESEDEIVAAVAETSDVSDTEQQYEHDVEDEDDDEDEAEDGDEAEEEDDDDDEGDEETSEVAVSAVDEDVDEIPEAEVEAEVVSARVEEALDTGMEMEDNDDDDDDDPPILPASSSKSSSKKSSKKTSLGAKKMKGPPKKKSKGNNSHGISGDRLMAAEAARDMLHTAVPRLPVPMNENYVVRNFGQLHIGHSGTDSYATPTALYPVGFSCDRYEFSPVHGRLLKLRCSIIDGKRTVRNYAGPIFRVMWGQGVDEAVDKVEYPYNPYADSAPISDGKNDVVAVPANSDKSHQRRGTPSRGMRVKVRFNKDMYYFGTIEKVDTPKEEGKKKRQHHHDIHIRYDDGSMEKLEFPDPDVSLVMPGKSSRRMRPQFRGPLLNSCVSL